MIRLDNTRRSTTIAVTVDSVLSCVEASSPDVYVTGIISSQQQHSLQPGESMVVPRLSTLTLRVFRAGISAKGDTAEFSAGLELVPVTSADARAAA